MTGGQGVDHIVETGGTMTLGASFEAIAYNGQIHAVGHIIYPPCNEEKLRFPNAASLAMDRNCSLRGVVVGSREQFEDMLACSAANSIRRVINRVVEFEQTKQAYEYLWSSSHVGKVVIQIPLPECNST